MLLYRGYDIGDLLQQATFEETAYLLLRDSLPNRKQLDEFDVALKAKRSLPEVVGELIGLSDAGRPIDMLRTAVSLLGTIGGEDGSTDMAEKGVELTAIAPTIAAAVARARQRKVSVAPDMEFGHAANFLYMLSGEKPEPEDSRIFDKVLVLHAEHGLNASTLAARVVASTGANVYGCISAALAALGGPKHGGASETAMRFLLDIDSPDNAQSAVGRLIDSRGYVPGFGHPVYKTIDPRALHLREDARNLADRTGHNSLIGIIEAVSIAVESRVGTGVFENIDLWSGAIYHMLGIPQDLYSAIFAMGRMPGWIMHVMEQRERNVLLRPRLRYVGEKDRKFLQIGRR